MLSGEYITQSGGGQDPYLKMEAENNSATSENMPALEAADGKDHEDDHAGGYPVKTKGESDVASNAGVMQENYALALLEKGLSKRRYYVRILNGRQYAEPLEERKKRIALWGLMTKSLQHLPYMVKGVDEHDVKSLWIKVCTNAQPNEREMMVSYITQLVDHKKESDCGFETWHTRYVEVIENLGTVGFRLPDLAKLGFLFYLLKGDKRFARIIEKCKDNDWNYSTCVAKLTQKATEIGDTKVPSTFVRQRSNQIGNDSIRDTRGDSRGRAWRKRPRWESPTAGQRKRHRLPER